MIDNKSERNVMEATQSLISDNPSAMSQPRAVPVSVEFVAYTALVLLALVLRLAQLDVVPMTNAQAREALAAWRVVQPEAAGSSIVATSPLLFLLHSLAFTTLGASEFAARIGTVLASIILILTPLFFRELLGRWRAFTLSLLLTFSPVLLIASRVDSPVIWTVLSGILALWALWRYYETAQRGYAALAMVLIAGAIFLTDPSGFVFILILLGAGGFALWMTPRDDLDELDEPTTDHFSILRERLQTWPWLNGLLLSVLVVWVGSTLFMMYPTGLSTVGGLLGAGANGLTVPKPGIPPAFPILIALFYEPLTVILGVTAVVWLIRNDQFTFIERFFTAWLVLAVLASVLYAGARAEQALWVVVPLVGLMSSLVGGLLTRTTHPLWWNVPAWSKWVVALVAVFLLAMFTIHLQSLSRSIINTTEGVFQLGNANSASVVLVIISLMSMVIGLFLAASIWGMQTTIQGAAIGLLAFGLVTSLSSGWWSAVEVSDSPIELWNREAISDETTLLRNTLNEVARRISGDLPQISIAALVPDDGVVAWLLRDYPNTRFIADLNDAKTQEIILLPMYNEAPDLGGSYVGQNFRISSTWNPASVRFADLLSWWTTGKTRVPASPSDTMVLWLRQDIYNGVPFQSSAVNS
jgi:hypothetical protein